MKKGNYLIALFCFGMMCEMRADQNEPLLPGHRQNDSVLVGSKAEIVVGRFISLGFVGSDAAGASYYENANLEVDRVLSGTVPAKLKASFTVVWVPANERETVPTLGTAYIMFIRKTSATEFEIAKVELATDKNVKAVEDLIAARNQGGSG